MIKSPIGPIQSFTVVTASFVVASVINVYPMNLAASDFRPMALIMVLIFWLLYKPRYMGVGVAFIIGLITDLLLDTRLGQQGFSAVIMAFSIRFAGQYIRQLKLPTAWLVATGALIVYQVSLWAVQFITQNTFIANGVIGLVMSVLTWPLVYILLIKFYK